MRDRKKNFNRRDEYTKFVSFINVIFVMLFYFETYLNRYLINCQRKTKETKRKKNNSIYLNRNTELTDINCQREE